MTKPAHTPGPWRCEVRTSDDKNGPITEYFVMDSHGHDIASFLTREDAVLVAQAPKLLAQRDALLAAAKRFFEVTDAQYADNFNDLRAAIAICEEK